MDSLAQTSTTHCTVSNSPWIGTVIPSTDQPTSKTAAAAKTHRLGPPPLDWSIWCGPWPRRSARVVMVPDYWTRSKRLTQSWRWLRTRLRADLTCLYSTVEDKVALHFFLHILCIPNLFGWRYLDNFYQYRIYYGYCTLYSSSAHSTVYKYSGKYPSSAKTSIHDVIASNLAASPESV